MSPTPFATADMTRTQSHLENVPLAQHLQPVGCLEPGVPAHLALDPAPLGLDHVLGDGVGGIAAAATHEVLLVLAQHRGGQVVLHIHLRRYWVIQEV